MILNLLFIGLNCGFCYCKKITHLYFSTRNLSRMIDLGHQTRIQLRLETLITLTTEFYTQHLFDTFHLELELGPAFSQHRVKWKRTYQLLTLHLLLTIKPLFYRSM